MQLPPQADADADADAEQTAAALRAAGASFHGIAAELNKRKLPGELGGRWYGATVHRLLNGVQRSGEHRCTARCALQERACKHALTPQQ